VIVDRVMTGRGELVLRRDGEHFEVISNGTFLMDTRNGESERLLVAAAVAVHGDARSILIGGLGVGFSLVEALRDRRLESVMVLEIEPTILAWHETHLAALTGAALADARTTVEVADLHDFLRTTSERYDVICLDVDNGPDWTVNAANASLYGDAGTALVASRLAPGGVLAVWSAARAPAYEATLRRQFARVAVHEVAVPRGEADVVMIAANAAPSGTTAR
jgi:spermidine synthase